MKKPTPGSLGPNDKYRGLRDATVQFLEDLADLVFNERYKEVGERSDDPVYTSVWYAKECASTLVDYTPADSVYDLFDQLENACSSATNLTMLLRAMDRNG